MFVAIFQIITNGIKFSKHNYFLVFSLLKTKKRSGSDIAQKTSETSSFLLLQAENLLESDTRPCSRRKQFKLLISRRVSKGSFENT